MLGERNSNLREYVAVTECVVLRCSNFKRRVKFPGGDQCVHDPTKRFPPFPILCDELGCSPTVDGKLFRLDQISYLTVTIGKYVQEQTAFLNGGDMVQFRLRLP